MVAVLSAKQGRPWQGTRVRCYMAVVEHISSSRLQFGGAERDASLSAKNLVGIWG